MAFRWSVFAAAMLLSGMVCALCAGYVLRRPGAVGRTGLAVVLAAAAVWGLAYGVELGVLTRSAKEFWGTAKYVGVSALPPAWLVFALQYTGRERLVTARLLAALAIEPIAVLAVMVVPATSALVRSYPPGALVWTANLLSNGGVGAFRRIDPTPVALALVLRDITERRRAERHLEHLAHYDSVTGLPNRKLFADRVEQALARARRNEVFLAVRSSTSTGSR